jgi:hypothetical protein
MIVTNSAIFDDVTKPVPEGWPILCIPAAAAARHIYADERAFRALVEAALVELATRLHVPASRCLELTDEVIAAVQEMADAVGLPQSGELLIPVTVAIGRRVGTIVHRTI